MLLIFTHQRVSSNRKFTFTNNSVHVHVVITNWEKGFFFFWQVGFLPCDASMLSKDDVTARRRLQPHPHAGPARKSGGAWEWTRLGGDSTVSRKIND